MKKLRKPIPLTDERMFRLADILSAKFEDFGRKIQKRYRGSEYRVTRGKLKNNLTELDSNLTRMKDTMVESVYAVIADLLMDYCNVAIDLIKESDFLYFLNIEKIIESVRLEPGLDYCLVTFLNDFGRAAEPVLKLTLFLQTIEPGTMLSSVIISARLAEFVGIHGGSSSNHEQQGTKTFAESLIEKLSDLKRKITNFSNAFCSFNVPFVKKSLVVVDDRQPNKRNGLKFRSKFVDYILKKEKCSVTVSLQMYFTFSVLFLLIKYIYLFFV